MVDLLDLAAPPPRMDVLPYVFRQTRRGDAGWSLIYARWRDKVIGGASFAHVMALVPIAATRGDVDSVLARAVVLAGRDPVHELEVARVAQGLGPSGLAWSDRLVQQVLATSPSRELYQLAARSALATGRQADALVDLEQAQTAASDQPAPLSEIRAELGLILTLTQQLAVQASGPARDQLVAKAMTWGERWRAIDPGNVAIDRKLGELLLAVGDQAGAWRQLSSTIERDPWSGTGYTTVAEAYEHQGKLEESLPFWQQAIVIDQTNPTPRLRKAQALLALGRPRDAELLLHDITHRKWHDVWSSVVEQASELSSRK